jgi:quercetin dioxygenase-like cupin family protein
MHNTTRWPHAAARISCCLSACTAALCVTAAVPAGAAEPKPAATRASAMTAGWTVEQLAKSRGVLFAHELQDVPGKDLVVVKLVFPPNAPDRSRPARCTAHTHPGSVWVYVTQGTARLGIAGGPVRVIHTGESFYEHKGAVHTVAESASATEPASAIAVMIVPEGAPLITPAKCERP